MNTRKQASKPYSNQSYGTEPTRMVRFLRTCFIKQIFEFFRLNLKIMRIVVRGHS